MILADANLLNEVSKPQPDLMVMAWIGSNYEQLYLPTPVLAELRYGCEKLPQSAKRRGLEQWLDDILVQFEDRILPFDRLAAETHGILRAKLNAMGKTCSPSDSYIAAIALSHDCPIATRNVDDFELTGVKLVNPWDIG